MIDLSNKLRPTNLDNFVGQSQEGAHDLLTSNGGGVGNIKVIDSNWPHVKYAQMEDKWDLQPFKEANRSALPSWTKKTYKSLKNF